MFEINGKNYELKYNEKRIELLERATNAPLMSVMVEHKAMPALWQLTLYVAYGLKEEGADALVDINNGKKMAETLIRNEGYMTMCGAVFEAIDRDCPFLFQEP